jgi:DNA helicase II / ATP-dependent DNA helicase PcrA
MNSLILANPGTGKTTTLANKVIELLHSGTDPKDILCITFTEKASAEMNQKIRELAAKRGLTQKFHDLSIHTFHSYALSYLEEKGETYEVLGNNAIRYSIFRSFMKNNAFNYSKEYVISDIVPKVENAIRYLKSYGITPDIIDLKKVKSELEQTYTEEDIQNITLDEQVTFARYFLDAFFDYEKSKRKGQIDYNDMLLHFVKLKEKKKYKHVLVDELQDVNELEAQIALESGDELFLVGDRKQAIFGFQGGSIRNFKTIEEKLKPKKEKLVKNYRSATQIVKYASEHFTANTKREEYAEELDGFSAYRKDKGKVEVISTDARSQEKLAVRKALDLYGSKAVTAIICRTNGQLIRISKILDSKGVKYSTTISNATSEEAKARIIAFLKGLLNDDINSMVDSLFTPFAGVSLKEAFDLSGLHNDRKLDLDILHKKATTFMKLRENAFSVESIIQIFENTILPISVSISKDCYITAIAIMDNIKEFFATVPNPRIDDLFDYLDITEESYEPIGKEEGLVLTTVHKAKGLEFDNVIYVPKETRGKMSFVDVTVYSMIKAAKRIDIKEELEEEKLRVDFVAFTRSRNYLLIVANSRNAADYSTEDVQPESYEAMDDEPEPLSRKYDEPYALFVNKRYDDAKRALTAREAWLNEYVGRYFKSTNRLSYSLIEGIGDPFNFFKTNIARIREETSALNTGNIVHSMAEKLFKKTLEIKEIVDKEKLYLDNIRSINSQLERKYDAKQIDAEKSITLPLVVLIGNRKGLEEMTFKAKMDAIYQNHERYVILDYKTDKKDDRASEHRRQLTTYRKMFAIANGIDESKIDVALGFVGLRGNVNTGRLECRLDVDQPKPKQFDTVKKHIEKFLEYKDNPELFVMALSEQQSQGMLHDQLKAQIYNQKEM